MSKINETNAGKISISEPPSSSPTAIEYKDSINANGTTEVNPILKKEEIVINKKKPSNELVDSIKIFGNSYVGVKKLAIRIRERAKKEGFSDLEIILLARKLLQNRLSSRQLNYWFPLKQYWKKKKEIEDSSNRNSQFVNNDNKNGIVKSSLTSETSSVAIVPIQRTQICSVAERPDFFGQSRAINHRAISYFDLADPTFINCIGHPMYQKAKEKIQRLEKVLDEKNHLILQLKENKYQDSEILAKVKIISTEIAATCKTDNHQEASNQSPNQT